MTRKQDKKTPKCFGRWSDIPKEDCYCEKADQDVCFAVENEMDGVVVILEEEDGQNPWDAIIICPEGAVPITEETP